MQELENGRHHTRLTQQVQFLLVARLDVLEQLAGVQFQVVVVPVLHFDLPLEVQCQFHYFLLARPSDLFDPHTLLVVRRTHVVQLLFQLSVFEFVLLFFQGWLLLPQKGFLIPHAHRVGLPVELGTGFCRGLALELERTKQLSSRIDHYCCYSPLIKRIIQFKFMINSYTNPLKRDKTIFIL